jgi:hypothetical protein
VIEYFTYINVVLTCSWHDWACFWHASTSLPGRIFLSARIRAGSRFKRFLCSVFEYSSRCLCVPSGVRVPHVEYHWFSLCYLVVWIRDVNSMEDLPIFRMALIGTYRHCIPQKYWKLHSRMFISQKISTCIFSALKISYLTNHEILVCIWEMFVRIFLCTWWALSTCTLTAALKYSVCVSGIIFLFQELYFASKYYVRLITWLAAL